MNSQAADAKRRTAEERELKFAGAGIEDLREQLRELEAERVASANAEDNWIYDRQGALKASRELLRLRVDRSGARLTFKGSPRYEGGVKIRREHETEVGDADEIHRILESLGFEVVHRYQKKREEWQLGGVTVALDHTPIGDFVEFEGPGADTVARRCGFEPETAEKRSYLELYEHYRKTNPGAPPDMVFS